MSDGKKFIKTDSNLTPEQRLEEVERKFSVIQERIQAYDRVLEEFANINSDLQKNKQDIQNINELINFTAKSLKEKIEKLRSINRDIYNNQSFLINSLSEEKKINQELSENVAQN